MLNSKAATKLLINLNLSNIRDLGSGKMLFRIPGQKGTGYRIQNRNT